MMLRVLGHTVLLVCVAALACSKPSEESVQPDRPKKPRPPRTDPPPDPVAKEPKAHRAKNEPCPKTGVVDAHKRKMPEPGDPCTSNADCKKEKNGRCSSDATCSYDECYVDGDCEKARVCVCSEYGSQGYRCLQAGNCRIDSDCAAGEYCSPSFDNTCGAYHGVIGYFCHTSKDECRDDDECKKDLPYGYCAFMPEVGHWACGHASCKG